MAQVQLIKFTSIDALNSVLLSVEAKRNKMRHTPYNGFNFDDSFVNHAKASQYDADIAYLKDLRLKMRQEAYIVSVWANVLFLMSQSATK